MPRYTSSRRPTRLRASRCASASLDASLPKPFILKRNASTKRMGAREGPNRSARALKLGHELFLFFMSVELAHLRCSVKLGMYSI